MKVLLFIISALLLSYLSHAVTSNPYAYSGNATIAGSVCCDCASGASGYNAKLSNCTNTSTQGYYFKYRDSGAPTTHYDSMHYDSFTGLSAPYNKLNAGPDQCTYLPPSANLGMDGVNRFCGDQSTYATNGFFRINTQQAPLCVVVGYVDSTGKSVAMGKFQWWIWTDIYSLLDLFSSYGNQWFDNGIDSSGADISETSCTSVSCTRQNWVFQVEFAGKVSPIKHRWDSTKTIVVPFWTLQINVNAGTVTSLTWDDGCYTCSNDMAKCVDNNCGRIAKTQCSGDADCGFKIYVVWNGSDNRNDYMITAGMKMSQFTRFSATAVYERAVMTAKSLNPTTNTPATSPPTGY